MITNSHLFLNNNRCMLANYDVIYKKGNIGMVGVKDHIHLVNSYTRKNLIYFTLKSFTKKKTTLTSHFDSFFIDNGLLTNKDNIGLRVLNYHTMLNISKKMKGISVLKTDGANYSFYSIFSFEKRSISTIGMVNYLSKKACYAKKKDIFPEYNSLVKKNTSTLLRRFI